MLLLSGQVRFIAAAAAGNLDELAKGISDTSCLVLAVEAALKAKHFNTVDYLLTHFQFMCTDQIDTCLESVTAYSPSISVNILELLVKAGANPDGVLYGEVRTGQPLRNLCVANTIGYKHVNKLVELGTNPHLTYSTGNCIYHSAAEVALQRGDSKLLGILAKSTNFNFKLYFQGADILVADRLFDPENAVAYAAWLLIDALSVPSSQLR